MPLHVDSHGVTSVVPMPNVDLSDVDSAEIHAAEKEYLALKTEREKRSGKLVSELPSYRLDWVKL